jgi:hypothetical protein
VWFTGYVSSGASPVTLLRLRVSHRQPVEIPKLPPARATVGGPGSDTRSSPASADGRRCAVCAARLVELGIVSRARAEDLHCMRFYFLHGGLLESLQRAELSSCSRRGE